MMKTNRHCLSDGEGSSTSSKLKSGQGTGERNAYLFCSWAGVSKDPLGLSVAPKFFLAFLGVDNLV
jgi:hypothetical protein